MTVTRVLIDTDPGVDDAAAILMAMGSPEIDLVGLTTVGGNVSVSKTTRNALRICELADSAVPVAAGAERPLVHPVLGHPDDASVHGADGMGGAMSFEPRRTAVSAHAVDFIAEQAADAPLSVAAIAPLTNLALALARHPQVAQRIDRLVIMGGARGEGNATPAAEFNIWIDPEAAERVFSSGIPIVLLPLDITHQAVLTAAEVGELAQTGTVGSALAEAIRFYEGEHVLSYGEHFSPLHDALATLYFTDPTAMTFVDAQIAVDCGTSISRGATLVNTSMDPAVVKNAVVGADLDRDLFARALIERVRAVDTRLGSRRPRLEG
jgi:purine nucleosidase